MAADGTTAAEDGEQFARDQILVDKFLELKRPQLTEQMVGFLGDPVFLQHFLFPLTRVMPSFAPTGPDTDGGDCGDGGGDDDDKQAPAEGEP